ncbi:MAG: CoA-binding protein [Desulfobacteraceae bacterium]|jgi:predicted CoA-binding protein
MTNGDKSFIDDINSSPEDIRAILHKSEKIAVVGLSPKENRPSNMVAKYLIKHGYEIVPVNPGQKEILGQKCYRSIADIPFDVDIADLFLNAGRVPDAVDQALEKGIRVIWMQLGIFHREAGEKALNSGAKVIMDKCIKIEHEKLNNL